MDYYHYIYDYYVPITDTENGTHNIIKAVENPHSQNVLDLIPNRYSKHRQYLQLKGSKVFCTVCKGYFKSTLDDIKHHILIKSHVVNSQIEALEYKYYCEICNVKFTDEDLWVKHHNEGPNRYRNIFCNINFKIVIFNFKYY